MFHSEIEPALTGTENGRAEELLRMILALSTNFIVLPASEIDDGIRDVLGAVGNYASVDRCYLFQFSEDGKRVSNTHEWCSRGVPSRLGRLRNLAEEEMPWLVERVKGLGIIRVPDTDLLPSKARAEKSQILGVDVQSLLVAPMIYGDYLAGFLGLDNVKYKRTWDEEIVSLLKIVGEILVNALARKKAAAAVKASEEKYRNIFENATEGIFQSTRDGRFLSINPAMARMSGYGSVGEMLEKVTDIRTQVYADPAEREEFLSLIERKGRVEGFETRRIKKDGSVFWVSVNARAVRDKNGNTLYYEGTHEDITARKNMEEMLYREREMFKDILQRAPYGVVLMNGRGEYLYVNPEYTHITGYTLEEVLRDHSWLKKAYPDPQLRKEVTQFRKEYFAGKYVDRVFSAICRDGGLKEIEFRKAFLDNDRIIITLYDITERKKAVEALRGSEEKFRTLFEESKDAIYIAAKNGRFEDCNRSFLNLFGYTMEEALKVNARDAYANKEDRPALMESVKQKGAVRDHEVKLLKKDGAVMTCLLTISEKKGQDGAVAGYQGIVRDITAFKKAEETIRHMAYHDALTGLPNRILFGDRLSVAMAQASRSRERVAVAVLDLDKFKKVNDLLGHKMGDFVLRTSANRLSGALRKSDTVARMGGDEFLLILNEVADIRDVEIVMEKIVQAFRKSFVIESRHFFVTVSIGVTIYPEDGGSADELVRRADIAMYHAKRNGKNKYCRYLPEMDGRE